jgi:hypothetical protein
MDLGFALAQQGRIDEAAVEAAEGFQAPMLHRGHAPPGHRAGTGPQRP